MRKAIIVLFFIAASISTVLGQEAPQNISLLTVECKSSGGGCHTQQLVRYDFRNGEFVSRETVLSEPNDRVRFDVDSGYIHRGRYIINMFGSIFDIQSRQLLGENRGELIDIVDDDVLLKANRIDEEEFFAFNLESKTYRKLPDGKVFSQEGQLSPNKRRYAIAPSWSEENFQFHELKDWRSKRKTTVKGSFSSSCSVRCSSFDAKTPFVWIDDNRILTQRSNGDIVEVNVDGKVRQIVKIKIDEEPDSLPYFGKNQSEHFYYDIGATRYSIDIRNKSYTKDKEFLGNDFEVVYADRLWKEYFYKRKSIGRVWSIDPLSYKGFISIAYDKEGDNVGYGDGIRVWNDIKKDWTTIEVDWLIKIIGWIENKL